MGALGGQVSSPSLQSAVDCFLLAFAALLPEASASSHTPGDQARDELVAAVSPWPSLAKHSTVSQATTGK